MAISWARLDVTSPSWSCYGYPYIRELLPDDLRRIILRFGGVLPPETANRDKLQEWAGYLYEMARYRAKGIQPPRVFVKRYLLATNPKTVAFWNYWKKKSEKAKAAFAKLAAKDPSPTSAMGIAFKILDEEGQMPARDLMLTIKQRTKRLGSLNSARSYISCWKRARKEKADGEEGQGETQVDGEAEEGSE